MDNHILEIKNRIESEPYARIFKIKVEELREGYSKVSMLATKDFDNMFSITQGGAIFSLADFAFAAAVNAYKNIAVAVNVNINYIKSAVAGDILTAEASEISRGNKTSTYIINVKNDKNELIASSHALAFIKHSEKSKEEKKTDK
ncbi:MAG: hotdog fold thioesterase [Actinobacteria bacterium]|jgi:acyl-CoA thioesterase|nr:hotdog fold thioesterase [Actinomycetota bacterium]